MRGGLKVGFAAAGLALLAAVPAWGAEAGGARLGEIIVRILNFAIAAGVLVWVFTRVFSLRAFFAKRRATIEGDLTDSQRQLDEANGRLSEIREQVDRLDDEVAEIQSTAEHQGEAEAERIVAAGHERSRRIAEQTRVARQQEEKRLVEEVRREVVEGALAAAEEMVASALEEEDHRRLVQEALS